MNKARKIVYTIIFTFIIILIGTVKSNAGDLKLNTLDFNAQINDDGSMDVIETWDIKIEETNTVYKEFKKDLNKYSEITNVAVKDITGGININFTKDGNWSYHVTKNHYYGTENKNGNFEIGWGVGLDNSSGVRKYEISYTVKDAITKYSDYAELYWQFIGKDFGISSDKIVGTIYLPANTSNINNIKVWGHTEDLNGTIYATDTNKINFEINNFRSGRYVEIRTLFPTELITSSGRTKGTEILQKAITEETQWADNANAKRERKERINKNLFKILLVGWILINAILVIIFIKKIIKYREKLKQLKKYQPSVKLEYYRDLPDEQATPGEAVKILNIGIASFTPECFGKVFSATMLDLALKGYVEIKQEKNQKGKEIIQINVLKEPDETIKQDEQHILEFIKSASKEKNVLTLKTLEKHIKNYPMATDSLLKEVYGDARKQLIEQEILDKQEEKEYRKYKDKQDKYITGIIMLLCYTFVTFIIPLIILIINAILCGKIAKKINLLTQKGVDQKEEWKGLKKYMEDFSRLDKREVPELIIWEKYLVFATAFGIADKVIKQLKLIYPNFDEMINTNFTTCTYINLMMNTSFNTNFSSAITSSMSSAYSSGSGSGGGFSGGGGFGRRPADGGGGGRKITSIYL